MSNAIQQGLLRWQCILQERQNLTSSSLSGSAKVAYKIQHSHHVSTQRALAPMCSLVASATCTVLTVQHTGLLMRPHTSESACSIRITCAVTSSTVCEIVRDLVYMTTLCAGLQRGQSRTSCVQITGRSWNTISSGTPAPAICGVCFCGLKVASTCLCSRADSRSRRRLCLLQIGLYRHTLS